MNSKPSLLELIDVRAGYRHAVAGPVSFAVRAGEVLGLAGPNGSGKTTLLRAITGTAKVFEGEIRFTDGISIRHHRQLPERPPELPMTVRQMLRLGGVAECGLPERLRQSLDCCLDELSGGEYQFLHAWCCLAGPADVVLMDEPTNNLDQEAIQLLVEALGDLPSHRAVVLVSHERLFLEAVCHRMIPF